MTYEYCSICDERTGKAGPGDGSLYDDDCGGPYCQRCYTFVIRIDALGKRISDLEKNAKLDSLSRSVTSILASNY